MTDTPSPTARLAEMLRGTDPEIADFLAARCAEAARLAALDAAGWRAELGQGATRDPDGIGPAGAFWRRDVPPHGAEVASWILRAPLAHPLWPNYLCSLVDLAEHPDVPAAVRFAPDMTHELLVIALNPQRPVTLDGGVEILLPVNIEGQFAAADAAAAVLEVGRVLRAVLAGQLSPDTDFRKLWRQVLVMA